MEVDENTPMVILKGRNYAYVDKKIIFVLVLLNVQHSTIYREFQRYLVS